MIQRLGLSSFTAGAQVQSLFGEILLPPSFSAHWNRWGCWHGTCDQTHQSALNLPGQGFYLCGHVATSCLIKVNPGTCVMITKKRSFSTDLEFGVIWTWSWRRPLMAEWKDSAFMMCLSFQIKPYLNFVSQVSKFSSWNKPAWVRFFRHLDHKESEIYTVNFLNLSVNLFPHLQKGDDDKSIFQKKGRVVLGWFKGLIRVQHLTQTVTYVSRLIATLWCSMCAMLSHFSCV